MIGMINSFKKWRTKAETDGWGVNPQDHDKPVSEKSLDNSTIRELLLAKCPWYYDLVDLFHDHPNVNAPYMVESGASDREAGCEVPSGRDDDVNEGAGLEDTDADAELVDWKLND